MTRSFGRSDEVVAGRRRNLSRCVPLMNLRCEKGMRVLIAGVEKWILSLVRDVVMVVR